MKAVLLLLVIPLLATSCRRPVTPADPQERIVSLAPSVTELVCAVGARNLLVGRTSACNYPPDIRSVPVIGGFGAPSLELLVAAEPTLVLDVDLADNALAAKLKQLNLRREHVTCRSLDDIPAALEQVGGLLHHHDTATNLATRLRSEIEALRRQAAAETNRPSVYVEIWHDPVMTAGRRSFISELITLAGGRNIGDDVDKDYFQASSEWIVSRDPDIILCLYMSKNGSARDRILSRNGWQDIRAVSRKEVFDGFDNDLILRPGPRVLESIAALRECIRRKAAP